VASSAAFPITAEAVTFNPMLGTATGFAIVIGAVELPSQAMPAAVAAYFLRQFAVEVFEKSM
jgi:hypothetical protein